MARGDRRHPRRGSKRGTTGDQREPRTPRYPDRPRAQEARADVVPEDERPPSGGECRARNDLRILAERSVGRVLHLGEARAAALLALLLFIAVAAAPALLLEGGDEPRVADLDELDPAR